VICSTMDWTIPGDGLGWRIGISPFMDPCLLLGDNERWRWIGEAALIENASLNCQVDSTIVYSRKCDMILFYCIRQKEYGKGKIRQKENTLLVHTEYGKSHLCL
jgi:hypothetical protein